MTESTARTVANVLLISAGVAVATVVISKPPLRRLAVHGLYWWLGASVPMFVLSEAKRAWDESAPAA